MASLDTRPTGTTRVRWRVPGESKFQSVTYADSADAKALAAVVAARGHRVRATDPDVVDFSIVTGVKMAPVTAPVLTYRQALEEWLGTKTKGNAHTKGRYLWSAERNTPAWLDRDVTTITDRDVAALVVTLKAEGLADRTVKAAVMIPGAVFGWLHRAGRVRTDPVALADIQWAKPVKVRRFLTSDEFDGLMAMAIPRLAPILQLMTDAGLRANEVLALQVRDVDPATCTIRVGQSFGRRNAHGNVRTLTGTKGGDTTVLPVSKTTMAMLRPLVAGQSGAAFVFRKENSQPYSYDWLRHCTSDLVGQAVRSGRLTRSVTPHDFRHTCGVWMLQAGIGLEGVQARLRHSDIGVTRREYLAVLPKDDAVVRNALSRIFDGNTRDRMHVVA